MRTPIVVRAWIISVPLTRSPAEILASNSRRFRSDVADDDNSIRARQPASDALLAVAFHLDSLLQRLRDLNVQRP